MIELKSHRFLVDVRRVTAVEIKCVSYSFAAETVKEWRLHVHLESGKMFEFAYDNEAEVEAAYRLFMNDDGTREPSTNPQGDADMRAILAENEAGASKFARDVATHGKTPNAVMRTRSRENQPERQQKQREPEGTE